MTVDFGSLIIIKNVLKNSNYAPYCLRCDTMDRMRKVEPFLWRCRCGAVGDDRENFAQYYSDLCESSTQCVGSD